MNKRETNPRDLYTEKRQVAVYSNGQFLRIDAGLFNSHGACLVPKTGYFHPTGEHWKNAGLTIREPTPEDFENGERKRSVQKIKRTIWGKLSTAQLVEITRILEGQG